MPKKKEKKTAEKRDLQKLLLTSILAVAAFLRIFNINWDQGFLMHPDERMLLMVANRIKFFSNLDPDFFNYGSLPIYILKIFAQILQPIIRVDFLNLANLSILGRLLSTSADILTIILIYKISNLLFSKILKPIHARQFALLPALLYSLLFFPIQNSHFFIVDTFLNFFALLLLYQLMTLPKEKKELKKKLIFLAITSAALLTTKVSGAIFVVFSTGYVFYHLKKNYFSEKKSKSAKKFWIQLFRDFLIFYLFNIFIFSFIFMPYAFLRFPRFISDILMQIRMNSDPYVFPYTLQYVDTPAYLYHLRNIFFWGIGPLTTSLSFIGLAATLFLLYKKKFLKKQDKLPFILFLSFYLFYFLIIGKSAVKFMRYMLPIYPFISILSILTFVICRRMEKYKDVYIAAVFVILLQFLYLLPFMRIYTVENTRVQATRWILSNIPQRSTLAVEHWDDRLPLLGQEFYRFQELQIYNQPDNNLKWVNIEQQLSESDYLIIASNRLYAPVQKLSDCSKYKVCYPRASEYYTQLLTTGVVLLPTQTIRFQKIVEFLVQPEMKIPFLNIRVKIPDQQADESFTVYDHPRIIIFKRLN